jgi:hypothetical protein
LTAIAAPATISTNPAPGRRYDHLFFSAMALLILISVFVGFARSYYLAGVFRAPLPARVIHFHGAVFSCWILLLFTQTALVSAHRVDIHRRLGLVGFGLACLMVVLGVLAATDALARNLSPFGVDPKVFYAVPMSDIFIFAVLIFFAFRERFNSAAHKRLILIATLSLMSAAFVRWPVHVPWWNLFVAELCAYALLLLLIAYDLFAIRTIHRATLWAGIFLISFEQLRHPFSHSSAWQAFASWAQSLAR